MREMLAACSHAAIDLTDGTDIPTLAAVLARMDLLVTGDSGVMHLAASVNTPVAAVFGPSNPTAWGPWCPKGAESPHEVISLGLSCQPCFYRGFSLGSPSGCPTRDCLEWLRPEAVIHTATEMLVSGERS
jgi:heptosyltransferase-2